MLMDQIRAAQLEARKTRNATKAGLLTTLIGEAAAIGKNDGNRETSDSEVVAVIKKFIKNIDLTLEAMRGRGRHDDETVMTTEKEILEKFLPSQLSEDQLKAIVVALKNEYDAGPKDMGKILGTLKMRHSGQYDGKMASDITKTVLAS